MTIAPDHRISPADGASSGLEGRLVPFRPQVQRDIRAMVRDQAEAEELTQDTYARAFDRVGQLRESQGKVSGEEREGAAGGERQPSLLEMLEQSEMSECVQAHLAQLPDDYRIAILLRDAHGLSNPEIAELLSCSLATAKIRVHRARIRIRGTLDAACSFKLDERGVLVCDPQPISSAATPVVSRGKIGLHKPVPGDESEPHA